MHAQQFLVYRTLDAAANRCREGLRVVEDYFRFQRNHAELTQACKTVRHELASCLAAWGADDWIACRDTSGDVGTDINTPQEGHREDVSAVVRANCKRIEESLRTLEEFGKILDPLVAARIEQLRYRCYTLEQRAMRLLVPNCRLVESRLYLLVSEQLCVRDWKEVVAEAIRAGVDVVQLREKELEGRELLERAKVVRELTQAGDALFIMNDRPDIALLAEADGVHLGQTDLSIDAVRRLCGPDMLIGVSTHNMEQLRQAVAAGANYVGLGPFAASQTKEFDEFAGPDYLRAAAAETSLPAFAIGGIDATSLPLVLATGVRRIAVSSTICTALDPFAETVRLFEILHKKL